MTHYTASTPRYPREAWKNKYKSYTSNFSGRRLGAGISPESMDNSIRHDKDESPELTSAACVERPSLLSPYNSRFGNSVFSRSLGPPSAGLDSSWRLTPVSPEPLDLGNGRVKEGPVRRETVRQSYGREESFSIASFLENGGHAGTFDMERGLLPLDLSKNISLVKGAYEDEETLKITRFFAAFNMRGYCNRHGPMGFEFHAQDIPLGIV